ncbi:MAG: hypothetical protein ACR2PL_02540, partial [Dehalococcoidia bacterium]
SFAADAESSFDEAVLADEGFALAQAVLALLWQGRGRVDDAKRHAERALRLVGGISRRERQHVEAISTAVGGDGPRALALIREHLAEFPRDALLLYQAGGLISAGGGPNRLQERMLLHKNLESDYGEDWWFLSAYGFAHHELDLFAESRRLSQRSLELCPHNAAATHNLSHVFYETNDHTDGAAFLNGWLAGYDRRGGYHCHLSWHLALFELAGGHYRRAMELYERDITPAVTQLRLTMFDASSLLWRYQLYGCSDAEPPWGDVCELAGRMAVKPGVAFTDAHAALAFAAAGDEAAMARLIDGLRELDEHGHQLAGPVVLPLVQGIAAFARGEYEETVRRIEPMIDGLVRLGGSRAQREVFEDTLLEAYLRVGRFEQAGSLLKERLNRRSSARDLFWLGRAQTGSGQTEAATTSLQQARDRWLGADADSPELAAIVRLQQGL